MRNGVQEVTGMVIKSMPVGERDRRVTLMTMEQGKLSFFARGAGKPGSPFMGVTRPFSYGKFSLFQGRDSYSLEGAEIVNYFEKLSADLVTTCYATYFLELTDYYAREFAPEPGILKLLYLSFLALQKPAIPQLLTRRIFELRLITMNGEYAPEAGTLSEAALYVIDYVCTQPLTKLYTFTVTEEVLRELERTMDRHTKKILDYPLKSRKILEDMLQ